MEYKEAISRLIDVVRDEDGELLPGYPEEEQEELHQACDTAIEYISILEKE